MGQSIQEWNNGRQPLKSLKRYGLLKQSISLQIFKSDLTQILPGPLLNTFNTYNPFLAAVH